MESGSSSSSSNNNSKNSNNDDDCNDNNNRDNGSNDIDGEKCINSVRVRGGGAVVEGDVSPYNNKNTYTVSSGNGISDGYGNINREDNGFESNEYSRNGQNYGFSVNGFAADTHHSQNPETREKKEVEEELGQECGHLWTLDRIESNQVDSKTSHLPANLESCSPSDSRSSSSSSCICTATSEAVYNTHSDTQHTHMTQKEKNRACGSKLSTNPEREEIEIKGEEDKHKYDNKDKNKNQDENEEGKGDDDGDFELVVIDVNYFPSYKEVPDFPRRLRKFLRQKAGMPVYT